MLTKDDAIKYHRMMWSELSETGSQFKSSVKCICARIYQADCPCCQFVGDHKISCCDCPIVWERVHKSDSSSNVTCSFSIYFLWHIIDGEDSDSVRRRRVLAHRIANLPER